MSTDGFDSFITLNGLKYLATQTFKNEEITDAFLKAEMPGWLVKDLEAYLAQVKFPLSVRSSSLL